MDCLMDFRFGGICKTLPMTLLLQVTKFDEKILVGSVVYIMVMWMILPFRSVLPVNIIEAMTVLLLLCIDVQEKQFSTSACLTSNCELLDVEPCEKDKSASTLQVHSEDLEV